MSRGAKDGPRRGVAALARTVGVRRGMCAMAAVLLLLVPPRGVTMAASPPASAVPRDVGQLVDQVSAELDAFWQPVIDGATSGPSHPYTGPAAVRGYVGGEVPDTVCRIGTGVAYWRDNARYCEQDATIWYDASWLAELARDEGDYAPGAIISHEWGHHLQALLSRPTRDIGVELEADCMAGMYLSATEGVTLDGGSYLIHDDDLLAALSTLYGLGDRKYRASNWFQPRTHGSSQQRTLAFATGYTTGSGDIRPFGRIVNGLDWCLGYADFRPSAYISIGPYRFLGPPGRTGAWEGDTYVIPPPAHPAHPTSGLRLRWLPAAQGGPSSATEEALRTALEGWLPGARLLFGANPLVVDVGDALTSYYEWRRGDDIESGFAALIVPTTGSGGLLVLASRPQPAPCCPDVPPDASTLTTVVEGLLAVNQVAARLCEPEASADPDAPDFDVVCMTDVQ